MTEESPHVQYEPCARIETVHDGALIFEVRVPLDFCVHRTGPPRVRGYFARPLWRHLGRRIYVWSCCRCLCIDVGHERTALTASARVHFDAGCDYRWVGPIRRSGEPG